MLDWLKPKEDFFMTKKLTKLFLSVAFVIAVLPVAGWAQGRYNHGINDRQRDQQQRIRQGVRNGELTRREAARIQYDQARIRAREGYYRRTGGEFTARERARIQRSLNRSSRHIYRQKHDRQDR
jgi:hypothetical protein